jgi:nitroimidazol reductase NimA-like FMN-containing flavoprotein (pyridoxamine 5'-phosphate oxidase superfamily)
MVAIQQQGIPSEVVTYLGLHHIITLSTTSFTGMPHSSTVAFANDDHRLYFYYASDSTLTRNLSDNKRVAFTVDDYTHDWRKVRELQGVGGCAIADAEAQTKALMIMRNKFGKEWSSPGGDLYVVRPFEMHFVDFDYSKIASEPEVHRQTFQLSTLPPPELVPTSTELGRQTYQPDEIIFRPGEGNGDYYVVTAGEVEIRAEGHGVDQTVIRVGPGGMFGDQAALRGQRGQLTAYAVAPTTLLRLDRDSVRDLMM